MAEVQQDHRVLVREHRPESPDNAQPLGIALFGIGGSARALPLATRRHDQGQHPLPPTSYHQPVGSAEELLRLNARNLAIPRAAEAAASCALGGTWPVRSRASSSSRLASAESSGSSSATGQLALLHRPAPRANANGRMIHGGTFDPIVCAALLLHYCFCSCAL